MDVQTIDTTERRLTDPTPDAIDALYGRPTCTPDERRDSCAFSPPEQEALQAFRTVKAQGLCIVQRGSCKAQHVCVPCDLAETHEDLASILASGCAYYRHASVVPSISGPLLRRPRPLVHPDAYIKPGGPPAKPGAYHQSGTLRADP